MYTRILLRAACAALAALCILPGAASASMALQGQRLLAADPNAGVGAANAVISGDWIAVFGRATTTEGGGQIMFFHRADGGWTFTQSLSPPDADSCVDSMAMRGDTLFVACPRALDTDRAAYMGVITVYTLSEGSWVFAQTIPSATGFYGNPGFGSSLAISGNLLFVGYPGFAPMPDSQVFGDVEVFDISTMPVTYQMQVLPDAWSAYSNFGSNVAASNGLLAVGANSQSLGGIGQAAGAVYTFESAGGGWFQRSVLTSVQPQPFDNFPSALVFQQLDLIAGSATNGAMNQDGSLGAAFTYGGRDGSMALDEVLMPDGTQTGTLFGQSLATIGNTVFVGEPAGGTGGRVHVYNSTASGWAHASAFAPADVNAGDSFGFALASDGTTLVITAPDSSSTGLGAVYVIDVAPTDQVFGDGAEF